MLGGIASKDSSRSLESLHGNWGWPASEQNSSKTSIHSQLNDFNEKCHYVIHLKKKYFAHMISLILKNMNTIQRR